MKKIITLLTFCFLFSFSALADEDIVSFSVGISSGVPFYSSSVYLKQIENIEKDGSRAIMGALTSLNLNVDQAVTFFLGTDFLSDFNWNNTFHFHVFTLDFSTGIKIFPNMGGFDIGLAYVLGYSVDYVGRRNERNFRTPSPWGNGVKVLLEYNFAHNGKSKFLPTVGTYWKIMPRGNNLYDNQLCAYVCANL